MNKYQPTSIEEKWMNYWEENKLFQETWKEDLDSSRQHPPSPEATASQSKMYLLYAFAYPSGSGLHVGHVEPKTALDILARYYRSIGKKVFFPVGWDAFGLPAENYAIKTGVPPAETTKNAIDTFRRQIKRIGISYDWATELATSHPGYYKWTQWIFLQLYEKGLAYKKSAPVNWCPSCQTVLANEQVVNGECERCGSKVIQKEMEQWFFKITNYREELIQDLEKVDWPKATKLHQLNWIGKSEGAIIEFPITNDKLQNESIEVFTTAHDTIYGATFMVMAPEHEIVSEILNSKFQIPNPILKDVKKYVEEANKKTEEERLINKEKTGVFSGLYAKNPLTGKDIPIWIADYVLINYGTGAIMAVPGNDERDFEFAQKFDLPIVYTAQKKGKEKETFISFSDQVKKNPDDYTLINSDKFNGQTFKEAREKMMKILEEKGVGKRETTYKLRDWLISRQRYWGAPIPIVYDPDGNPHPVKKEHLPWKLPTDVDFKPTGESPLKSSKEFQERVEKLYGKGWRPEYDTMDTFVDSSWYYLRYTSPRNDEEFATKEQLQKWMPVDFYMIGAEHTVLHLLYSRFFTKFLRDEGYLTIDEPFMKMRHQGMILGPDHRKMSKSKGNVINPDDVIKEYGADTLRMYEMFMGPIDADKPWNETSVAGIYRFLTRVWKIYQGYSGKEEKNPPPYGSPSFTKGGSLELSSPLEKGGGRRPGDLKEDTLLSSLHQTIQKVGEDIEMLKFNTAIASMMEFMNKFEESVNSKSQIPNSKTQKSKNSNGTMEPWNNVLSLSDAKKFVKILSPFAPFMTEEIWQEILGEKKSIHLAKWPDVDKSKLVRETVMIPVQINGKVRETIEISKDADEETVVKEAINQEKVQKYIPEGKYKKVIFVKGKIVNFIV